MRRSKWVALLLVLVMVAAACGDDKKDDASGGGGTSAPKPAAESRFTGTDAFCKPSTGAPKAAPEASDDGITADAVQVTHVRLKLEDLESIGYAVDLGDQNDFASTFVDIVNNLCGGINGRKLALKNVTVTVPGFDPNSDAVAQKACISIAEDQKSVFAWSNSGVGVPLAGCLTGPHDVVFMTTYDLSPTDFEESDGRLFSVSHSPVNILTYAARELKDDLKGKKIGIVHGDTDPDPQITEEGLVKTLKDLGLNVVREDTLSCPDGPPCTGNLIPSAQGMIADGVDVIFPLLDTTTMPGYIKELVTQGAKPGDIQFYNTSFQAQDSELVTGKIVEFGGADAGKLYNGAILVSGALGGQEREPGYKPDAFSQMCNDAYAKYSKKAKAEFVPTKSGDEARFFSSVSGHCAFVRMLARAIEAAGPNPTRKQIAAALGNLGKVDLGEGVPGTFKPGKPTAPDVIARLVFRYPCPVKVDNKSGSCVQPQGDLKPIPEG